jgi:hypothetical protein
MRSIIKGDPSLLIKALEENEIKTYTLEAINDDFTYVVDGIKQDVIAGYHIWGLSNIKNLKKVVETLEKYISNSVYFSDIKIDYLCTLTTKRGSLTRTTILFILK